MKPVTGILVSFDPQDPYAAQDENQGHGRMPSSKDHMLHPPCLLHTRPPEIA